MNKELKPVEKRLAIGRTWADRMENLLARERVKNPDYSEAKFCEKHGFDCGFFNRNKNLRVVPSQKTVEAIEKAFAKEGI